MAAPRTTHTLRVRSYEIRPDGRAGSVSFLNWFQEAAFANSTELGYPLERYQELGVSWVMRESDLKIIERPRYNETISITTWIADMKRVLAYRQYEARAADGRLLARCNTQWVMIDLATQRPTRIPDVMMSVFEPGRDFILEPIEWPTVRGESYTSQRRVSFFEEDEMAHVNNAVYLNWIEENARRLAHDQGLPIPHFDRHLLTYRLPAFWKDDLTILTQVERDGERFAWQHRIEREGERLVEGKSLSNATDP